LICALVIRFLVVMLVIGKLYAENYHITKDSKLENTKLSLQNNPSQWDFFADMLILKANEIATWALNVDFMPYTTSGGASAVNFSQTPKAVNFNWDVGVRAGLGYRFEGDRWDTRLYYTWFQTRGKDRSVAPNADADITTAFLGQWLTFGFASSSGHIQWNIHLNALDWELGRDSPVSKGLSFRPYVGLKGAWIDQTIHSQWISKGFKATENLKNDFWGLGPKGGVNTNWHLGSFNHHSFNLFGDVSLAVLGGRWSFKDIQKTSANSSIAGINPTTGAATFMFHGLMGFSWDVTFNKQSNIGVRVGYEFQYWYDQLKVFTFLEGTLHAALVLQGGMLDVHANY
jgi:hypothetical protein